MVRASWAEWARRRDQQGKTVQESYLSTGTLTSAYKDMPGMNGEQIVIRRQMKERSASSRFFADTPEGREQASSSITGAVHSARQNVIEQLDVDGLIQQLRDHEDAAREVRTSLCCLVILILRRLAARTGMCFVALR